MSFYFIGIGIFFVIVITISFGLFFDEITISFYVDTSIVSELNRIQEGSVISDVDKFSAI